MGKLKTLWYKLVARGIVDRLASREDDYQTLLKAYTAQTNELQAFKAPRPLHADVNSMLRKGLSNSLENGGFLKNNKDEIIKELRGRVDLLRQQLRQELAYIHYLETKHGAVAFNDLPLEEREACFKHVDALIKGKSDVERLLDPYGR